MKKAVKTVISLILACVICVGVSMPVFAATKAGDIDGDGTVTLDDALLALRAAIGLDVLSAAKTKIADMDGDGKVTTSDARKILLAALEIEPEIDMRQHYLDIGFPESYVDKLVALNEKYPEWEFVPFDTGLKWSDAVTGERTPHKKQLIEKSVASDMKCTCSTCNGVIFEAPVWMAASQKAVEYFLDPRNFLDEEHIFQFESTAYSDSQTQDGVEAILKSTWMANAYITYLDADGNTKTFTLNGSKMKYSEAIMKAAKENNLSAYYIASKIVQEVGSTKASNAGGSSGTLYPYKGIYNYYNIGAYTGATDGLEWANGYMCVSGSKTLYKTASTSTKLVTIPSGTELYYIGTSGDYYKVRTVVGSTSYTGYIKKSDASLSSSYGRPWDNPYKSIYYGAKYIYDGFSEYQFTGYLQKFNVNKNSGNLYWHEYMGNVRAAAFEAEKTYDAYVDGNILENAKVFSIPVFYGMPNENLSFDKYFATQSVSVKVSSASSSGVKLTWGALSGADGYTVYKYNSSQSKYTSLKSVTATTYTDTLVTKGATEKYYVTAYYKDSTGTHYSKQSNTVSAKIPTTASGVVYNTDGEGLRLRSQPTTSGSILVTMPEGTTVTLLEKTGSWYKVTVTVSSKTYTGYCSADYIRTSDTVKETTATGVVYNTDGEGLNMRASASTSGAFIVTIPEGTSVTVYGKTGNWYKVSAKVGSKTYTGYCYYEYIKVSGTVPSL